MKKCPRCFGLDDDTVRFCKKCGTELFFEYRFPGGCSNMKIIVINGTEVKGCTYHIKEAFWHLCVMNVPAMKYNQHWIDHGWLKPKRQ